MIPGLLLSQLVLALIAATPTIDSVVPAPLPRGATAEVLGAELSGATLTIADLPQQVLFTEPARLRFMVAATTPLGAQTLVVTTAGSAVQTTVVVVPPAPVISALNPVSLVLGGRAAIQGTGLGPVTSVTLDGVTCTVSEKTDVVIAFEVPLDPELLGQAALRLDSPSGPTQRTVSVTAPLPVVDALVPNPVVAGSLLTIRGAIVPLAVSVRIGGSEAPVLSAVATGGGNAEVLVFVPRTVAAGSRDVLVRAAGLASTPAGPLLVQAPAPDGPNVTGVFPARLATGGDVWVVGENLKDIRSATNGLSVLECNRRACRLGSVDLAAAPAIPFTAAVVDAQGAAAFELEASADTAIVPVITGVAPNPATRGQTLVITGTSLGQVRSAVVGGVAQSLEFVDFDRIEVTVAASTPLGAERLFVAGNAGSLATVVTVLDPLALPEPELGPETVEPTPEVDPESTPEVSEPEDVAKQPDGGCAGSRDPLAGLILLLPLLAARMRPHRG